VATGNFSLTAALPQHPSNITARHTPPRFEMNQRGAQLRRQLVYSATVGAQHTLGREDSAVSTAPMRMTRESLDALASLTSIQRRAVRLALCEWQSVASAEGYEPNRFWTGFAAYVSHSAALQRLMSGSPLFVEGISRQGEARHRREYAARARVRGSKC
jgi:hypothetical protein